MTPDELDLLVDTDPLRLRDEALRLTAEVERLRNLWAAVARDARNFAAEARGRREHGEQLTADRDAARAEVVQLCQERLQLVAERDEARAALDRVRELHGSPRTERHGSGCIQCAIVWPCPTLRALGGSGT